jgi:hypothetical protein
MFQVCKVDDRRDTGLTWDAMLSSSKDSVNELLAATAFLETPTDAGANAAVEDAKATSERAVIFIVFVRYK